MKSNPESIFHIVETKLSVILLFNLVEQQFIIYEFSLNF